MDFGAAIVGTRSGRARKRWKKLGQPVPLSNLVTDANNGWSQPAQRYTPPRFSLSSGEEKGISVDWRRNTACAEGLSRLRHSASLSRNGKPPLRARIGPDKASPTAMKAEPSRPRRSSIWFLGHQVFG
jgi:hypothetical protein